MMRKNLISFVILSALVFFIPGCGKKKPEKKAFVPPRVQASKLAIKRIPLFIEGIGHIKAFNSAEIKAQVEGRLEKVLFEQGSDVGEGALLVEIDPRSYEALLKEAEGALLQTKANLQFAEDRVIRYSKLVDDDYVSKINYDEYVSNYEALIGTLKEQEGKVDSAKINLDYCYIRAPFSGRVGKKLVDKGNLITNDGSTLLVMNQIQPIYADVSVPERDVFQVLKRQKEGDLKVQITFSEGELLDEFGKLIVVDNQVNRQTGMVPLRAQFTNENKLLWPGQFVRARVILDYVDDAIMLPESALSMGQKGYYVIVITGGKAKIVNVTVGERIEGFYRVLTGLDPEDIVVTEGQINVQTDKPVDIVELDAHPGKKFKTI